MMMMTEGTQPGIPPAWGICCFLHGAEASICLQDVLKQMMLCLAWHVDTIHNTTVGSAREWWKSSNLVTEVLSCAAVARIARDQLFVASAIQSWRL
jgi:hypothetical protein